MRLRILHVLASSVGGGASHVYDLIVHQKGIEQKLAVSPDGGTVAQRLRALGHAAEEIDMAKGWKWSSLLQLIRLIRTYRPTIVHCHGFRAGLYGRLAAKLSSPKIKTLLTVHGFHFYYSRSRWKRTLHMTLERLLKPLTDHVIAVSMTDWRHLIECKLVVRARSRVILNGIPLAAPAVKKEKSEGPIIATVARLHHQKGVSYFLDAVPEILRSYPDARFQIIGDGPERAVLEQKAHEMGSRVQFSGNRDDVADLLASADVFVLASLWEGLPLSLLEAMRAGVPVVATDVDGNRDVVQHGVSGLLVPPKNGMAIAKAVTRILADPIFAKGIAGRARIRLSEEFSLANMLQKTRQTYEDIV
jgi:glycosyltransferase involved in cell wall biosynthesis